MRNLILAGLLSLAWPCHGESPQETAIANGIISQTMEFLSSLIGPGKARVTVLVSGEMRHTQSSTSVFIPSTPPTSASTSKPQESHLPGYSERLISGNFVVPPGGFTDYAQGAAPPQPPQKPSPTPAQQQTPSLGPIHESQENSDVSEGFVIKKLLVSVILDSHVAPGEAKEVERLLPSIIHLDPARGDKLTILRAQFFPPWKLALQNFASSSKAASVFSLLAGALLLTILFGFILYVTAMRVVKTFIVELASARRAQEVLSGGEKNILSGPEKNDIPEILPGGIPSLSGPESGSGEMGSTPLALGQRFDFLASRQPPELATLLAEEPAEEIALLLASLAGSSPEIAAAIFSALPASKQKEASQALMGISVADPEKLNQLETKLRNLVEFGVRGPERLGRILSRLPADEREAVVSGISPQDSKASEELEKSLFSFDDLSGLSEVDLRRVIMGSNYQEWGLALRGAPQILIDAILKQLPAGARNVAREAIEAPQQRAKVLEMRSRILSRAQALAERGEISLGERNASELI